MQDDWRDELHRIGQLLDSGCYPVVRNGGLVEPRTPAIPSQILGKELDHVRPRKKGPEARSGAPAQQGTFPWSSSPYLRPRASHPPAPLVGAGLREKLLNELGSINRAYPGTQHRLTDDGLWLVVESSLLPGFSQKAIFIVAIRFANGWIRGWGFWGTTTIGYEWIGPRHTNFPDGSICAFDPADGTWDVSGSFVGLIDLYTLWAARQLYHREFGRWPGYQSIPYPYERILELRADEFCGCSKSSTSYGACCFASDRAINQIEEALQFTRLMSGGIRKPPPAIVDFLLRRSHAPNIALLVV